MFSSRTATFTGEQERERWGVKLRDAITILPTPTTMDHLSQRSPQALKNLMEGAKKGRKSLSNLREAVNPETQELFNKLQNGETQNTYSTQTGKNMVLNPQFVEILMGLPLNYSQIEPADLSCSETD